MVLNLDNAIAYMRGLKLKGIRYSMYGSRTGIDGTGDCSGCIYKALLNAGCSPAGWVLNTDSMHDWLIKNGFKLISYCNEWNAQKGDIVISGKKGESTGAAGHVFMFVDKNNIIHCTYKDANNNGVYEEPETNIYSIYNKPFYVYRYNGVVPCETKELTLTFNGKKYKLVEI